MFACTIVARNYLPHARVLARSFLDNNPGSRFATLIIDDRSRAVSGDEPFEVLRLDDLIPDEQELHLLAAFYDVMELATAVKPILLRHLLQSSGGDVVYLDPDIQVYAALEPVTEGLAEAPIALTPHTVVAYPRDGLRPTEAEIMGSGIYNLGFIGVRHGAEDFLRWWWERLQREAVVDLARMLFTDQRWIDFVPGLFPHVLLKDPGLNVAYWNLHGRQVLRTADGCTVNGQPLRFFHFSGYSPFRPDVLSKHTGDHPRVRLQDAPVVAELAAAYGERLVAEGLTQRGGPSYGWDDADGGLRLDAAARRAYRDAVLRHESSGSPLPPDPFAPGNGPAFLRWLGAPEGTRHWRSTSRYLQAVYDMRKDLQTGFPDNAKGSEKRFLDWARQGGLGDDRPAAELAVLTGGRAGEAASVPGALPSVNVVGYFKAEMGMGEHGRQFVAGLRASGAQVSTTTWTDTISRQQHEFEEAVAHGRAAVNVMVVNADQTAVFREKAGEAFFAGSYTVGAWAWELEEFPEVYDDAFDLVDEVWANSSFARDAIAQRTSKPVFAVPPPIPVPAVDPRITRAELGLPEGHLFLFAFDYLSVAKRKNAEGVLEAFVQAFAPGEGPVLVLKSINAAKDRAAHQKLKAAAAHRDDVILLDTYMSAAQRNALMGHADCYVSLHRSEGLGLTMAEAMALGKPVIATAYSGNLDFMDDQTAFLVPYERVPVGEGAAPYAPTAHWAEPDVAAAASIMRQVHNDQEAARKVGARAAEHIAAAHSPAARALLFEERLRDVARRVPSVGDPSSAAALPPALSLGLLERRVRRLRFIAHVVQTPELRRAMIRRRLGGVVSAGFGQSRRAIAQQEATRREVLQARAQLDHLTRELDAVAGRITLTNGRADQALAETDLARRRLDELSERATAASAQLAALRDELMAEPYRSDPSSLLLRRGDSTVLGYTSDAPMSYADFEDCFRGTSELIEARQRAYVPLLSEHAPVLDLGCGRGEMLVVLREEGLTATGIDSDASMVDRCVERGLDVVLGDALAHLDELEPGSLGAVVSFQFIEHLSLDDLRRLFRSAHRALRSGGIFVAETVNPHSPRALKAFWLDLTHRHPVYPEAALFSASAAGFSSAEIFFPHGVADYEQDRVLQGEYAVVARK